MEKTIDVSSPVDFSAPHHPAMSWRSVVAGFLISVFTFAVLMSLGMAIGGVSLQDGADAKTSGIASGIWMIVSVLLSLGVGSYVATRVSKFASPAIGMAQATVLAALFTGFVLWQVLGLAGWLTSAAGSFISKTASVGASAASGAASGNGDAIMNQANDLIEDNLAGQGVQFTPDAKTVVSGVSSRLLRGNAESAKAYLARHSNLTQADINAKLDQVNAQVKKAGDDARVGAAKALQVSGWSLFAMLVLSWIGATIGGLMAATANARMPITNVEFRRKHTARPAYT